MSFGADLFSVVCRVDRLFIVKEAEWWVDDVVLGRGRWGVLVSGVAAVHGVRGGLEAAGESSRRRPPWPVDFGVACRGPEPPRCSSVASRRLFLYFSFSTISLLARANTLTDIPFGKRKNQPIFIFTLFLINHLHNYPI